MRTLIVCLLAASTALAFPADDERRVQPAAAAGGCPGGYAEGAEIERGRIVYVCQGGKVVAKSCIAENLNKIPIGGNFDNNHYRRACAGSGDEVTFEPVACVKNGQEHKAGETWEDGNQVLTCKQNPQEPLLDSVSVGCAEGGKRLNAKEQIPKADVLYECQQSPSGKYKLAPAGCVKDGKQLKAGETIEVGKVWFNCSLYGRETVVLKAVGCILNGKRLNDGDRTNENDVSYECVIAGETREARATACIQHDGSGTIERKLGCSWIEGQEPTQYEWTCQHDAAANTATKVQTSCSYKVSGGAYAIAPGAYRVVDNTTVAGCTGQPGPSGSLSLKVFQGDGAEKSAQSAGLHSS